MKKKKKKIFESCKIFRVLSSITAIIILVSSPAWSFAKEEKKKEVLSYRVFPYPYAKVWNSVVQLVVDMEYLPEVADPQEGFMSTQWKLVKGGGAKGDKRIRIHINVKKTADGALVTVRCEMEEFIPVGGTGKGKWVPIPSDNTCESGFLDKLEKKLRK